MVRTLASYLSAFCAFLFADCYAGPMAQNQLLWASNCNIRNSGDNDSAFGTAGGGAPFVGQQIVLNPSTADSTLSQQWNLVPDTSDATLWYFMAAGSATVSSPQGMCLTVQNGVGAIGYLDLCQETPLQEYRLGLAYTKTRYLYHIIPARNLPAANAGLIPANYVTAPGTGVIEGKLSGTSLVGVTPGTISQPAEVWSVENCLDGAGNPLFFGSGWPINGAVTGY